MSSFNRALHALLWCAFFVDFFLVDGHDPRLIAFTFRPSAGLMTHTFSPVSLLYSGRQDQEKGSSSLAPDDPFKMMNKLKDMGKGTSVNGKIEQFEKLKQLETRLKKLQDDQMQKEENYQERIRNVMGEMDKKEKDLLGKVQYFSNQLQQYRFDSQKSLTAAKEASDKKEAQLKEEIRTLRLNVEELEGEYSKAKAFTEELMAKRDSLEKELSDMKSQYAKEMTAWENRYELEQNERKKEQKRYEELLRQAQEATKKAQAKGGKPADKQTAEKLRELYAQQLSASEERIRAISAEVKEKAFKVEELELERSSLRKMFTRSLSLVGARVKDGAKKVLLPRSPKNASSLLPTSLATDINSTTTETIAPEAEANISLTNVSATDASSTNATTGGSHALG